MPSETPLSAKANGRITAAFCKPFTAATIRNFEDIKFDLKHFADIERLALVGDRKWEAGIPHRAELPTVKVVHLNQHAQLAVLLDAASTRATGLRSGPQKTEHHASAVTGPSRRRQPEETFHD
jgi:hypothetical protein